MRRRVCLVGAVASLSGCGWRPVYAPDKLGIAGPAQSGLAATNVGLIPERSGQLLRLALQERFQRFGLVSAPRFSLTSTFSINSDAIGIQTDSSATRIRLTGVADWQLTSLIPPTATLTSGFARDVEGVNVIDQQYFAVDLETDSVQRRIADVVADQITRQLASYFVRTAPAA
jgi:LPS-assembly lipoprotein